ncbi:hypothetical protein T12_15180 [Trichinella patagoniensis]|uniref:Uncharacterized protein n=1 Tax=Trichinella patagoniensis TaxID=990121 RepID=A0A0V0ZJ45_9BILA|nr:hypothetical protein T12_15180 [Trichinella patagoniensis]
MHMKIVSHLRKGFACLGITFAVNDCVAKLKALTTGQIQGSISQFDEISELDDYVGIDAAVITSNVPTTYDTVNDIHCAKQEDSDDSDMDTTTAETIPLKTYPELNECVANLERFIEATESADEGIFKVIFVVRQFVKDHSPKLKLTTLNESFSINEVLE